MQIKSSGVATISKSIYSNHLKLNQIESVIMLHFIYL